MSDNPRMGVPDVAASAQAQMREVGIVMPLGGPLVALRDLVVAAFPDLQVRALRGEITFEVPSARLVDVVAFVRDEPGVRCEYLMDLSGVHWPGGTISNQGQETTGWPVYTAVGPGVIEVDYVLYSVTHGHRLRLRVTTPDDDPSLPSLVHLYSSANVMERECYDFFGVRFEGHPNLVRIHMPEEWEGHPQRKDYPLGGVEVEYKGAFVPPPDERKY